MNENNWKNFDLERVVEIIVQNGFRMVSLQFVDEYLPISVDIYLFLQSVLPETVELYLIADSTWGTSIDDISANHVSTDLLVYFGSDLSSSSSIPVVIVLESKPLNLRQAFSSLSEISSTEKRPIALFYEPCYYWAAAKLSFLSDSSLTVAELPAQADLMNWSRVNSIKQNSSLLIGGLRVPSSIASEKDMIVVYIGNKNEQMENILLRLTGITFYHYNPVEELLQKYQGNQTRQLMERYGGIEKVRKAKIIGLLIGSMGYDSVLTNGIINRLEILIKTAGKYFYTFVMGRINEAKLCNFPEIDVYCLIANEDNSLIKPKTFHVPVVTPYELEIGIGARDWESQILTNLNEVLSDPLEKAIERIQKNKEEGDEFEIESEDESSPSTASLLRKIDESYRLNLDQLKGESTIDPAEQQLMIFESPVNEFFQHRTFRGLNEFPVNEEEEKTVIYEGQVGIAASYSMIDKDTKEKASLKDIEDI